MKSFEHRDESSSKAVQVRIDRLVPGGEGMGRLPDGRAAFVPRTVPGDLVFVKNLREKKSFVRALDWELLEAGSERTAPACPIAEHCGGCDWMHLDQRRELDFKVDLLKQALLRTGGFVENALPAVEGVSGTRSLRYRSRVRMRCRRGRLGYFAAGSHEFVEAADCLVASHQLTALIAALSVWLQDRGGLTDLIDEVELWALDPDENVSPSPVDCAIHFLTTDRRPSAALRAAARELDTVAQVRWGQDEHVPMLLPGSAPRTCAVPGAFIQVNREVNDLLVEQVLRVAERLGAKTFLDIYCGNGNFSLPLLARGLSGVGIESSAESIVAANLAAREFGQRAHFEQGDARDVLSRSDMASRRFDLCVVDPPRRGAKEILSTLLEGRLGGLGLIMVSCDPVTLARDLKTLCREAFELQQLLVFDMFPQTHHLETMAVLSPLSPPVSSPASAV